jgi:dephospho-CoA kinase
MRRPNLNKKKIILGVTGSFGSGKSTVAGIFKSFGAKIIDADKLAHKSIGPGNPAYKKIIKAFGKDILRKNKIIERRKLAAIVFNNKKLLKKLNNIIHPEVIRTIKSQIKNSHSKIIVLDVPLLIEAGLRELVDKIIVVKITRIEQIKRIQKKTTLSKTDILKRIKYQIPLRAKARLADFIIDNSGTIGETKKQAVRIRRLLWKN